MSFVFQRLLDLPRMTYSVSEVAEAFGRSPRSVQRWMRNGSIPAIVSPAGRRRIPREFLVAASPNFLMNF